MVGVEPLMAGSSPDFDTAGFNAAIRAAMQMGAPLAEEDRATFHFPQTGTATHRSEDDVPWDPDVVHDRQGADPVTVDCAVEYAQPADQDTRLGIIRPTRIQITLLQADYDLVKGCEYVVYGGERYAYRATEDMALFDAGVYTLHFTRAA